MPTLSTGRHTLVIKGKDLTIETEGFIAHYDPSTHKALHIAPENGASFELMVCRPVNDALVLYHLETPPAYRGQGFGELGIAFFYYVLEQSPYSRYAMKFGGGQASRGFLHHLGFPETRIHTAQDAEFVGDSVLIGEFMSTGSRGHDWKLDPIPITTFPTQFFEV